MSSSASTIDRLAAPSLSGVFDLLCAGDISGAETLLSQHASRVPRDAAVARASGLIAAAKGDQSAADSELRASLVMERSAATLRDLAAVSAACGRWREAAEYLAAAREVAPEDSSFLRGLAESYLRSGQFLAARDTLLEIRRANPDDLDNLLRLAGVLRRLQEFEAAQATLHEVIDRDPDCATAYKILGMTYLDSGHPGMAIEHLKWTAERLPGDFAVKEALERSYFGAGQVDECLSLGATIKQEFPERKLGPCGLIALLHSPAATRESIRSEHERWREAGTAVSANKLPGPRREGRIRVGYHSGEFYGSPAIHFVRPLFEKRDRDRFEVYAYNTGSKQDGWTQIYRSAVDVFRDAVPCQSWADVIARDRLDILVDVSGHYGSGRLDLFRSRLAPVQIAFPSYPATTGMDQMDYIFTDRWVCPHGAESQYSESPLMLHSGYLPYLDPTSDEEPSRFEPRANGMRFGLFQRPAKMNRLVWDTVAEILARLPDSSLLVHFHAYELDIPGAPLVEQLTQELTSRGVCRSRFSFRGPVVFPRHMALLASVDVALDTFPYNGQTTACECLWMGVPYVTLIGETHVSRVGYQILDRVGLGDLAASSVDGYIDGAVRLARDEGRRKKMRPSLREAMRASSLMNGDVVREIESYYHKLARKH